MPAHIFDYAVVRLVPRVERGEFLNVGVVLFCATQRSLAAKVHLDRERARAFAPHLDLDLVAEHLSSIPLICTGIKASGPIGQMEPRARFHWLVAPRSTILQISPVHSGSCDDLPSALDHLFHQLVLL